LTAYGRQVRASGQRGGSCPCCRKTFKAEAPEGLEPGSPFGANLRAFALYLRFTQAISLERLSRLFSDLLGMEISEGALVNIMAASREPFAAQAEAIRQRLLSGTILQSDETSARVGNKNWWLWTFHNDKDACFRVRPSRGKAVVEDFLGEMRPDYWVSDRYGGQKGFATKEHQICLAHLLRDAQYAIDAGDTVFAPDLRALLQEACGIGQRRPGLADATLHSYASKLERKLDRLLRRQPTNGAGKKLLQAIKGCRSNLFVFLSNRALPPTNNGSEQNLRSAVIFRKVTNCFRAEWSAHLYADIRSVLETARRRSIGALEAIRLTLAGLPLPALA
jgi:transposase